MQDPPPTPSGFVTLFPRWVEDSSPSPGANFTVFVEREARKVRQAVHDLQCELELARVEQAYAAVFAPRLSHLGFRVARGEAPYLVARALVAEWLSAYALRAIEAREPVRDAEAWFLGPLRRQLPRLAPARYGPPLEAPPDAETVFALLPYLLDPLAPGTRRSVMQCADESLDRTARKSAGSFYTPGDVAVHMLTSAGAPPFASCLDPACGSGVFLRTAMVAGDVPLCQLFGCDRDPLAVDACAFVLSAAALARGGPWPSPWSAWQAARSRLATLDSLHLHPGLGPADHDHAERAREEADVLATLSVEKVPPPACNQEPLFALGTLFPSLRDGPELILSNPPYAPLGERPPRDPVHARYRTLARADGRATTRIEALFVELACELASTEGAVSLVLPLSVAASLKPEFVALREMMQEQSGAWRFGFFDRAPDALFGDDVKTRNAIITYRAGAERTTSTTGLLRWTSRTRRRFFSSISHCAVERDIAAFIPKVNNAKEAALLTALRRLPGTLGDSVSDLATMTAGESRPHGSEAAVYIAPTAYNWLGCARDLAAYSEHGHTSKHPLITLLFASKEVADAAFAVLSSRLTFWLWRVEADGFHVTRTFLRALPFGLDLLPEHHLDHLAAVGRALWCGIRDAPVVSVNRQRRSVSFSSLAAPALLDAADRAVARAFGVHDIAEGCAIRAWHENLIVVDFERRQRSSLPKKGIMGAA